MYNLMMMKNICFYVSKWFRGGNGNLNGWWALASWHPLQTFQLFIVLITVCKLFKYLGGDISLHIYMFSFVGKISWNSIKSNSMQMNTCTNYACGVTWSPKFATCAKSSVLLCQFLLLNPIYASFSNNPFFDNLFVGTDSTSWIWLRLSLIRFSTFQ